MAQAGTYSFLDVQATIVGPGGNYQLGAGVGAAKEGISVRMSGNKNVQTVGADGAMNSLIGVQAGQISVRLLKTSPTNNKLSLMYNLQKASSSSWGLNVISIRNPVSGDSIIATYAAFQKLPDLSYATEADIVEWTFDCSSIDTTLGGGLIANLADTGISAI